MPKQIKDRQLRMLIVDDLSHGRAFIPDKKFETINITLVTSTRGALEKLLEPFDILCCHIKYDEKILGEYAKRKNEDILTIGFSGGGLSDYMVRPLGYDEFVESDHMNTSYDNVAIVLKKRGLI